MKSLLPAVLLTFSVSLGHAFPLLEGESGESLSFTRDARMGLDDPLFTADYDFEGIVSLSGCSGSLVRYEQSQDRDPAMVLSNGHCLGRFPAPGRIIVNQPDRRRFRVFGPGPNAIGRLQATKIIYATMTKTDLALFELGETYEEIFRQYGVRPLTLSSRKARVNDDIEIISGYWRRGYRCQIEKFVHQLREDRWTMEDSMRYSRPGCQVIGGTSGAPVILAGSRTVVGVNNTGNRNGRTCTNNNPCEVDENGEVTAQRGYSYGQQTYWLYSCLNDRLEIDLSRPGCQLHH